MLNRYKIGDKVRAITSIPHDPKEYVEFFIKYPVLTIRSCQLSDPPRYWFEENRKEGNNYGRDEDELMPHEQLKLEDFL